MPTTPNYTKSPILPEYPRKTTKQLFGLSKVWETYGASGGDHDWMVRCRPDLRFTARRGQLMIPRFCNYRGYNDRFAIMRREVAMRYFTRLDILDSYLHGDGIFHPETFLKWCMEDCAMVRTEAVFHTVRKNREMDEPLYFTQNRDERPPL
jgi:hypothetical protein